MGFLGCNKFWAGLKNVGLKEKRKETLKEKKKKKKEEEERGAEAERRLKQKRH